MTGVCGRYVFCGLAGCVPAANDRSIVLFDFIIFEKYYQDKIRAITAKFRANSFIALGHWTHDIAALIRTLS